MLLTGIISGRGFTVMLNDSAGPEQPFENPETLTTAVIGVWLRLVAVKVGIKLPPFGFNPNEVLSVVQLIIDPDKLVLKLICGTIVL
jgi:hypothetical protein